MMVNREETITSLKELSSRVIQAIPAGRLATGSYKILFRLSSGKKFLGLVDPGVTRVSVPAGVDLFWYNNLESVEFTLK